MRKYILFIISILFLATHFVFAEGRQFVHPGISHKKSDIERMRAMIQAKIDPWFTSFSNLSNDNNAKYTYTVKGSPTTTKILQSGDNTYSYISSDARAAYLNALMWVLTDDTRHADKAVEILNAWKNVTYFEGGGTESLAVGRVGWLLVEAAELIKSTYSGWAPSDIQKFKDMLVYPGYSNMQVPADIVSKGTFYWRAYMGDAGRHGNQDLFGWRLVMSMGVFLDNEIMYDRALRYFSNQKSRTDDLKYTSGPPINSSNPSSVNEYYKSYSLNGYQSTIPDYGYNGVLPNFIWENGQCQESSRDQDHAILGLGLISSIAEIAWNQGTDLYSIYDNRILTGYEWALRYNVSNNYSFPDQPTPWEPTVETGEFIQRSDRSGRWYSLKVNPHYESDFVKFSRGNFRGDKRPVYEVALAHYDVRVGLNSDMMKWTKRALEISNNEVGYETSGWSLDHSGWGGITFHRTDWMTGDPVHYVNGQPVFDMPEIPCSINAVNYDYFTADGQNRTYYDATPNNEGSVYRIDAVDITTGDNGYVVNKMQNGEWLSFTIKVPVDGEFNIVLRHNTSASGAKMKAVIDGDLQVEANLPHTNGYEETTLGGFKLTKGAKVIRIFVTGESDITLLSQVKVILNPNAVKKINIGSALNASNQAVVNWSFENIIPANLRVFRATINDFSQASSIKTVNSDVTTYTDAAINGKVPSYYYWIVCDDAETQRVSEASSVSWGCFFDNFVNPSTALWSVVNGTGSVSNNVLNVNSYSSNKAYLSRTGGVTFHAGNYPILAYKMTSPSGTTFAVHNAISSILGGGANKQTGILDNNVYYYDLRNVGFVSSTGTKMVPLDSIMSSTFFQIRMTATNSTPSQLHWIGTFKSVNDLSQYIVSGVKSLPESGIYFNQYNDRLVLRSVNEPLQVRIFSIAGQLISHQIINTTNNEISLPDSGVYIVSIKGNTINTSQKVIVN